MQVKSKSARVQVPALKVETLTMPNGEVAEFTIGSGNVFADLGLADPEERLFKAQLAGQIARLIEQKGWTQTEAAQVIGLDQPKVSKLLSGRLREFSLDRLFEILRRLGRSVEVRISAEERSPAEAQTSVLVG
jgi:predicted XRE-type DNA-binding protein